VARGARSAGRPGPDPWCMWILGFTLLNALPTTVAHGRLFFLSCDSMLRNARQAWRRKLRAPEPTCWPANGRGGEFTLVLAAFRRRRSSLPSLIEQPDVFPVCMLRPADESPRARSVATLGTAPSHRKKLCGRAERAMHGGQQTRQGVTGRRVRRRERRGRCRCQTALGKRVGRSASNTVVGVCRSDAGSDALSGSLFVDAVRQA